MKTVDPILIVLALMIFAFTALLFSCAIFLKNDGQTFQVISSLLTGFSGAFLGRIMPKKDADHPPAPVVPTPEPPPA